MQIYVASKTKYAARWLRLRARGWPITCSWLTRFNDYDYAHLPDVAEQCVREASEADALILYAEERDELRGAFMEAGAALASGVLVWSVNQGRWNENDLPDLLRHPLVRRVCCVEHALNYAVKEHERAIRSAERTQRAGQPAFPFATDDHLVSRKLHPARPIHVDGNWVLGPEGFEPGILRISPETRGRLDPGSEAVLETKAIDRSCKKCSPRDPVNEFARTILTPEDPTPIGAGSVGGFE